MNKLGKIAVGVGSLFALVSCSYLKSFMEIIEALDEATLLLAIPQTYETKEVPDAEKNDNQRLMDKAKNHEKKKYKGLSMNFWLKRFDYNKNEYTKDVKDTYTLTWSDEKATWEYDEVWDVNGERKFKEWMYVVETYTMDDCISYFYNSTNPTFHFGEDTAKGAEVYNHYYCYVTEDAPGNEGICQYEFFWGFNVDGYLNHYDISWMHDKIHDSIEIGCSYYE